LFNCLREQAAQCERVPLRIVQEARDRPDSIYRLWQFDAGELAAFAE
jgi:hypothetical protein